MCILVFPYNDIALKGRLLLNISLHFEAVKHILALLTHSQNVIWSIYYNVSIASISCHVRVVRHCYLMTRS